MKKYLILFLIFLSSCVLNGSTKINNKLQELGNQLEIDISDYKSILIIPLEGCGTCIQDAELFFRNYSSNTEILFIFCTYKPFNYSILNNIKNSSNIIIDSFGFAHNLKLVKTGPVGFVWNANNYSEVDLIDSINYERLL